MARLLRPTERIVDLGCGGGAFLAHLRALGFDNLVGADISSVVVKALLRYGYEAHRIDLEHCELAAVATPRPDVIVLSEVLEHVTNLEDVLDAAVATADRVVLSHPNIGYWPHRLRLLRGRFPVQWGWHPAEHVRFLTVTDLLEHVHRRGYRVVSIAAPIGVPNARLRARWPNLLAGHVVLELTAR